MPWSLLAFKRIIRRKVDRVALLYHKNQVLNISWTMFDDSFRRVLLGEYGSGKTQLLMEKVRQTAWDMHYAKVQPRTCTMPRYSLRHAL